MPTENLDFRACFQGFGGGAVNAEGQIERPVNQNDASQKSGKNRSNSAGKKFSNYFLEIVGHWRFREVSRKDGSVWSSGGGGATPGPRFVLMAETSPGLFLK